MHMNARFADIDDEQHASPTPMSEDDLPPDSTTSSASMDIIPSQRSPGLFRSRFPWDSFSNGSSGFIGSSSSENSFDELPLSITSPLLTQDFVGRKAYLHRLYKHFELDSSSKDTIPRRKIFLLYGAGGVGKTLICLKFMDQMAN
ncbi:hypothetical protein BDQ17DRAFT_972631 [Cyathus striatus]|nr:hypothetical protein BDQ17DRAFT_972631 [Cyathus striatus]